MEVDHYYKTIYTYISGNNISKVDVYEGSIENNAQLQDLYFRPLLSVFMIMRSPYSTLNKDTFMVLAGVTPMSGSFLQKKSPNNPLTTSISIQGFLTISGVTYTHNSDGIGTGNGGETFTYGPLQ